MIAHCWKMAGREGVRIRRQQVLTCSRVTGGLGGRGRQKAGWAMLPGQRLLDTLSVPRLKDWELGVVPGNKPDCPEPAEWFWARTAEKAPCPLWSSVCGVVCMAVGERGKPNDGSDS